LDLMLAEYKTLTGTINQKAVNKHILAKLCFRKMSWGNARDLTFPCWLFGVKNREIGRQERLDAS
jgi:hypothetical protein